MSAEAVKFVLGILNYVGLTALPFSLFFAWSRIGYKVAASYTWKVNRFSAPGPSRVTLINMKDRPLAIFGIHAVADNLSFNLKEFDPPQILKGMEAINVELDEVSSRYVGNQPYDWRLPEVSGIELDIYLSTSHRTIKCRRQGPPTQLGFALKRKLIPVINSTQRFNGILITDRARFAVVYIESGVEKTAIIDNAGSIDWHLAPNQLRPNDMLNEESVRSALSGSQLTAVVSRFVIEDLQAARGRRA